MRRDDEQARREPLEQAGASTEESAARVADQDHLREIQRQRQGRVVRVIVALVLLAILIIFIVSNSQPVAVDFVFVTRRPRLIWVMFGCAILGGIVGYLIGRPGKQITLHRRTKEQKAK